MEADSRRHIHAVPQSDRGGAMRLRSMSVAGARGRIPDRRRGRGIGAEGVRSDRARSVGRRAGSDCTDSDGLPQAGVVGSRPIDAPAASGTSRLPTRTGTRPAMRRRSGTGTACIRPPIPTTACPWACGAGSARTGPRPGLQIDCMVCHGGSIGGKSYVGLGNTQLDLRALLNEMTIADGRRPPPSTFVLNSSRGTNNAGHGRRGAAEPAQSGPLVPHLPLAAGRQPPRDGHPSLVAPQAQGDDVLRRAHRCPIGPHQHAVPAGREDPRRVQGPGADLPRPPGVPEEPRASEIPVPDRRRQGRARQGRLREDLRPMPRHLWRRTASTPTRSSLWT